jgi:ribosomal-protein-alanine N-acetyltransferase
MATDLAPASETWPPARLAALHARCFTRPRPWSAAEFGALLNAPGVFLCPTAAGFILGRATLDEAEVLTLAVAPEARRSGKGRALLAAFEMAARTRAAAVAFLEVSDDNTAALALYRGAGYVVAGRRRNYFGAGVDGLVLRKPLTRPGATGNGAQ